MSKLCTELSKLSRELRVFQAIRFRPKKLLFPKIVFFDLEGTLLQINSAVNSGIVAPSAWAMIALALGEDCYRAEERSQLKWASGGYPTYIDWMIDTVALHRAYGLNKQMYDSVIEQTSFVPGASRAVEYMRSRGARVAIVTGSLKGFADKAQRHLRADHAFYGCEYFFDPETGLIEHCNLLPSDNEGKAGFMQVLIDEYGLSSQHCAFVGDGRNDVFLARKAGFSVAFNAQHELEEVASVSVRQPPGQEDLASIIALFDLAFPCAS